jgi:hypothetical protein
MQGTNYFLPQTVTDLYWWSIFFLYYFFIIILSGVRLSPLGTAAIPDLLYEPQMIDDGDCRTIGGMKIGRGNRSTRRKPAPAPLCPPQIPHDQTRARTRAAAVGSQRLTAWAMARPLFIWYILYLLNCLQSRHRLSLHLEFVFITDFQNTENSGLFLDFLA